MKDQPDERHTEVLQAAHKNRFGDVRLSQNNKIMLTNAAQFLQSLADNLCYQLSRNIYNYANMLKYFISLDENTGQTTLITSGKQKK
jgi:hypothetical protein